MHAKEVVILRMEKHAIHTFINGAKRISFYFSYSTNYALLWKESNGTFEVHTSNITLHFDLIKYLQKFEYRFIVQTL